MKFAVTTVVLTPFVPFRQPAAGAAARRAGDDAEAARLRVGLRASEVARAVPEEEAEVCATDGPPFKGS